MFAKPSMTITQHIKPLYIKTYVNKRPISNLLIDSGSAISVMLIRIVQALRKTKEDLLSSDVTVASIKGDATKALGVLPLKITVGTKTLATAFFMVDIVTSY